MSMQAPVYNQLIAKCGYPLRNLLACIVVFFFLFFLKFCSRCMCVFLMSQEAGGSETE